MKENKDFTSIRRPLLRAVGASSVGETDKLLVRERVARSPIAPLQRIAHSNELFLNESFQPIHMFELIQHLP